MKSHPAAWLLAVALPAGAAIAEPSGIAPGIRATADEEPAFMLSANGVHVYHCKQSPGDPNAYAWYFTAPDATLHEGTRTIGTHKTVTSGSPPAIAAASRAWCARPRAPAATTCPGRSIAPSPSRHRECSPG